MYKVLLILLFSIGPLVVTASDFSHLAGRIVLQVEKNGEAWYIAPDNLERVFLGRPSDAFALMREKGIGITNIDLEKIPVADNYCPSYSLDCDNSDRHDFDFARQQGGMIFLQVDEDGEAWYVNPVDSRRYFLARPNDAFEIMRKLGLGISNDDIDQLVAFSFDFDLKNFEKEIHDLVNAEREKFKLKSLLFNEELANVAREHSQNLANENEKFTGLDAVCSYPFIHHEGLDFGAYQNDRLASRNIKYYNMSGENIALLSLAAITLTYQEGSIDEDAFRQCNEEQDKWDRDFKESINMEEDKETKLSMLHEEINKREEAFSHAEHLEISSVKWQEPNELAIRALDGWMNSPGHRANILKGEYDEAGTGAAYVNSYVIITQVFIRKTDCGYAGAVCCERDDYLVCYQPNTCIQGFCQ